jgi:branched-chain amino acid transport system permease protein
MELPSFLNREELQTPKNMVIIVSFIIFALLPLGLGHPLIIHIMILAFIFSFGGMAWNWLAGYCGQYSLGHSVFFAAGAYGVTLTFVFIDENIILGILIGIGFSILLALVIALLSFRLRGVFFSMVTLASAFIMTMLVANYTHVQVSGYGEGGWLGFTLPRLLDKIHFYYISLVLVAFGLIATYYLTRSRFGNFMVAVREDEDLAKSLGINTYKVKTITTVLSAIPTAIIGMVFALYIRHVSPIEYLQFNTSWNMMVGPMIGGLGTLWGALVGTLAIYPIGVLLQGLFGSTFAGLSQIITGAGIFLIVMFAPGGFMDYIRRQSQESEEQSAEEGVEQDNAEN